MDMFNTGKLFQNFQIRENNVKSSDKFKRRFGIRHGSLEHVLSLHASP